MAVSLKELESQVLVVPYIEMEPHLKRGAVILIDEDLSIAEVGLKLALDDKLAVARLLAEHKISKASTLEFEVWRQHKQFFKILIVQPFVLAQNFAALATPARN
jgi:hypothetical protein